MLKHQIPVKTDSWDVRVPGFTEVDLVSHSGNSAAGDFAHTLNVTDIHTAWTESRAVLGRGEEAVQRALQEIRGVLPFALRGVDSDNGSEFINWHLKTWCEQQGIQLTRGRQYKKDDNAHVEQKNWTHVRKLLGWERYDTHEGVTAINDLYGQEASSRLQTGGRDSFRNFYSLRVPTTAAASAAAGAAAERRVRGVSRLNCRIL